ncbi:MAG: acetate kinase [Acidobacteriaceae bacterium]|nr:acetate kinase [Acidobacteriaceae bacterium]
MQVTHQSVRTSAMNILVLNPGGNSLKIDVIACGPNQHYAFEASKSLSVSIEGIGKQPMLSQLEGKKHVHSQSIEAENYRRATESFLSWYEQPGDGLPKLAQIDRIAVRVVHGGREFDAPALIEQNVEKKIIAFEELAPLHNKSSVEVLAPLRQRLPNIPIYGVFDTAFHRTIPEHASRYALPPDLADRHQILRYGFHGISHRYLLERYAHLVEKTVTACNIVSLHLESGCSVTAVREGKSIDNTMGLTPLEGLMMGTRSGDIDPSLIPLLMRKEGMHVDEVMTLLNKKSGLLGVSGESLDTRVLMEHYNSNSRAKLAMDMFSYRVRKAVGAQLAVLGSAEAVVFGGGIGENTTSVREYVCEGLRFSGLEIDAEANRSLIDIEGRLSTDTSKIAVWVIPTEEALQIAHECCLA